MLLRIVDQTLRELFAVPAGGAPSASEIVSLESVLDQVQQHADPVVRAAEGNLPWGLVYPLERLCRQISQESCVMLYPHWERGYSYFEALAPVRRLASSVPSAMEAAHLQGYPRYLALFSYPDAQSCDVLSNAAWGHEIGHHVDTVFHVSDRVFSVPIAAGSRSSAASDALPRYAQLRHLPPYIKVFRCWVHELVADLFAVHIFGPAALFAFAQIVPTLDAGDVASRVIPPAWLRVTAMLEELDTLGYGALLTGASGTAGAQGERTAAVKAAVASRLDVLRTTSGGLASRYVATAHTAPVLRGLLEALSEIRHEVRAVSRQAWACSAAEIAQDVFALVERLAHGVPPCEVAVPGQMTGRPVRLAAIVNAGWFYRIERGFDALPEGRREATAMRDAIADLNTLVLKGIELSVVKQQLCHEDRMGADGGVGVRLGWG